MCFSQCESPLLSEKCFKQRTNIPSDGKGKKDISSYWLITISKTLIEKYHYWKTRLAEALSWLFTAIGWMRAVPGFGCLPLSSVGILVSLVLSMIRVKPPHFCIFTRSHCCSLVAIRINSSVYILVADVFTIWYILASFAGVGLSLHRFPMMAIRRFNVAAGCRVS